MSIQTRTVSLLQLSEQAKNFEFRQESDWSNEKKAAFLNAFCVYPIITIHSNSNGVVLAGANQFLALLDGFSPASDFFFSPEKNQIICDPPANDNNLFHLSFCFDTFKTKRYFQKVDSFTQEEVSDFLKRIELGRAIIISSSLSQKEYDDENIHLVTS